MKLKKWVINLLIIITFVAAIIGVSECDSNKLFIIKTIVSIIVISFNGLILYKYGRI